MKNQEVREDEEKWVEVEEIYKEGGRAEYPII